jgi:hypothetical protein
VSSPDALRGSRLAGAFVGPLLALLLTSSCSCGAPPVPIDNSPCRIATRPFTEFLVPGMPARVRLRLSVSCPDGTLGPKLDDFTSEVLDPDNKAVAHSAEKDTSGEFNSVGVVLSFTPDRPGTWHLSATLNPGVGIAQGSIEVVEWRGDAGVQLFDWPNHPVCDAVDLTGKGSAVCLRNTGDSFLSREFEWVVHRPGGVDESHFAASMVVIDDVVWSLRGNTLERRVDDGVTVGLTHSTALATLNTSERPPALAAWREHAWVLDGGQLLHVETVSDGGLAIDSRQVFAPEASNVFGPAGLAVGPDRLLLVGGEPGFQAVISGGTFDGGFRHATQGLIHLGSDPETIWLNSGEVLIAVAPRAGGFEQQTLILPEGSAFGFASVATRGRARVVPMFAAVAVPSVVPRLDPGRIALELYDAGPEFQPVGFATRRHAFAWSLDGGRLKAFDR